MTPKPMSSSRAREVLERNLEGNGLSGGQVHVSSTAFGGLRVRAVHEGLRSWSERERRERLLIGLDDEDLVAELLTPDEVEWFGDAFPDSDEPLPTWADVLEGEDASDELLFASDLDSDIERPVIVTFYSLRGGVGRTTALGSVAKVLAAQGRRVLCVDMDFEAPGLSHFFGLPSPGDSKGCLQLLVELDGGGHPDVRQHIQRVADDTELYVLPAGEISVAYAKRLRLADPEIWYREPRNPLHELLDLIAESSISPDIILIDSRTGIAPISAPLLFDVSDLAVICLFPHPQARVGTELLVRALFNARSRRSPGDRPVSPEPRFLISPVPPGPSAERVRDRAARWIGQWLEPVQGRRAADVGPLQVDELTHFISYSPDVAFRDLLSDASSLRDAYGPVADWLEQLLPGRRLPSESVQATSKRRALEEMDFATGTAEQQERFREDFVPTRMSLAAMEPDIPLVIGRKGTGKTAIFRWLLENEDPSRSPVVVMCPNAFRARAPWVLGSSGFESIHRRLETIGRTWSDFWASYIPLAAHLSVSRASSRAPAPPERLNVNGLSDVGFDPSGIDELHVVDLLSQLLQVDDCGLLGARWLRDLDRHASTPSFLLFDGLDTGFGNSDSSRIRRMDAVTGLFTFMTEVEPRLGKLSFKVLLRYDIWQGLRFENKSHLLGRSIQLVWRDQAEYYKTVLKQAVRSARFREMLDSARVGTDVDAWLGEEVFRAWNILVGERMKGGKTTFTKNWVWNRLADGQGDHGPRALYQLFHTAVAWEQREESRSPYDRSIIRPRALVPSLERVSGEAVNAIHEEFPELQPLIDALEAVGRTPLSESDIAAESSQAVEELELALEVGMLALHPGGPDEIRRFRVPELYRHALKVSRPGQA